MQTPTANPARADGRRPRPGPSETWLPRLALLAILALATLLVTWNLGREGLSNVYYAAAVRSMLQDPVTFLFAGFDSGRYITLDKPPLGYQLQAVSAAVLGFNGAALLLPQLVATVLSVWLVYLLVRPAWGPGAGLLAALALALMPVSVAVARNTTVDATLVAVLLAGALALQRGLHTGRLRWLALAFALVGVGFELKMLQAWLVLPAFAAAWLVAAPSTLPARVRELALATVPLLVVSFAWPAVVAAWPVDYRPWIGGSRTNSLVELAFGYNGLERLATGRPGGDTGTPGPLRFLEAVLAGQVGWLLPFAVLGAILPARLVGRWVSARARGRGPALARGRVGSLVLWAGWLATGLVFFSVARFWHRHYLVLVAPAVAALAGIGAVLAWRAFRRPGAAGWLLPIAVVLGGLLAAFTTAHASDLGWLAEPLLVAGLLLGAGLGVVRGVVRLGHRRGRRQWGAGLRAGAASLAAASIIVMLAAPAAWSAWTVTSEMPINPVLPTGGPPIAGIQAAPLDPGDGGGRFFDPFAVAGMVDHAVRNRGDATWVLAVEGALEAAPVVVDTGLPVMAIGGFQGTDPAIGLDAFRWLVREGRVRFVSAGEKVSTGAAAPPEPTAADVVLDWVVATCEPVPAFETLRDCAGRG